MANISERRDKDGTVISFQIRVFRGRDASGKRLKDYPMTWKTARQVRKELERQATLFEEACRNGQVSIEKPTLEKYANYVIDLKQRSQIK